MGIHNVIFFDDASSASHFLAISVSPHLICSLHPSLLPPTPFSPPQENVDKVKSGSCKEEVFYFTKREVKDLSLDIPLKKACSDDLSSFCGGEEDHSRALLCLRKHRDELAPACKEEELRFSEMEVRTPY